jgi:hypothetical protein
MRHSRYHGKPIAEYTKAQLIRICGSLAARCRARDAEIKKLRLDNEALRAENTRLKWAVEDKSAPFQPIEEHQPRPWWKLWG